MSKSDPTIKINPSKATEIEFEVVVQGTDEKEQPQVRFVVEDDDFDRTFKCARSDNGKHIWCAKIPALKGMKKESYPFHVEVVVDGYFFAPAKGSLVFVQDPTVNFQTESSKPSVTTSFTVKQVEDPVVEPVAKPVVPEIKEASGGGEVTGQYAPTNALLTPEFPPELPPKSHMKAPGTEKDDENIDMSKLSDLGKPVPGPGTYQEPEGSDTYELEMGFDPRSIAERIVKDKVGAVKRPEKQGTLFARDASGKPMVKGMDTPEQAKARKEKSDKVKKILGTT